MHHTIAGQRQTLLHDEICLFVDFDGTLVEFASTPAEVSVDEDLRQLLGKAATVLKGAVAIVSGRPIAAIDSLLAPLRLPVAGLHGFERRNSRGHVFRRSEVPAQLNLIRARLAAYVAGKPGLLLEDKIVALALHYRMSPRYERGVREQVDALRSELGSELEVLEGDCVLEIKPTSHDKASAVEAYLQESPFAGRIPVFLGDDVTDLQGFAAVRRHDGVAIAVGERVSAAWSLATPAAARDWLWRLLGDSGRSVP